MAKARRKPSRKAAPQKLRTRTILIVLALAVAWVLAMLTGAYILLPRKPHSPAQPPTTEPTHPAPVSSDRLAEILAERTGERLAEKPTDQAGRLLSTTKQQGGRGGYYVLTWQGREDSDLIVAQKTVEDFWSGIDGVKVSIEYPEHSQSNERITMTLTRAGKPLVRVLLGLPPPPPTPPPPKKPPVRVHPGRVAIIIDDMGAGLEPVHELLAIGVPITFAVLPNEVEAKETARELEAAGAEIMLHMPMEPTSFPDDDPGRGALLLGMSPEQITRLTNEALAVVPQAKGVNNHMGSAFTADAALMKPFLEVLKQRGLFFVDSRTNYKTVAYDLAQQLGIPSAQRRVFLDHTLDEASIRAKVMEVCGLADKEGFAIAIGHPHPQTIEVLTKLLPELQRQGYRFVHVSEVVK